MKKVLLLVCFSCIFCFTFSQSTFDKSLTEVSTDIAGKLNLKNKKRIVVLYVTDLNKSQTIAGKYIADVISVNIVNDQGNFEVFDRENLSGIAEAKKMIAEGYIDAEKVKELGKILAVDAIVIGNYTVLTTTLKLTLKALDVNSGFVIAATMRDLPITDDTGALLGINVGSSNNNTNRGFNNPINSDELINNPGTVDMKCKENKTGDYCFTNNTAFSLKVTISGTIWMSWKLSMTLSPSQTQCFYEVPEGVCNYEILDTYASGLAIYYQRDVKYKANGQIRVEQCKSKTFIIK